MENRMTTTREYNVKNRKWVLKESYDEKLKKMLKNYFQDFVFEELMRKVFHPKNAEKFEGWGFEL
jgi:hypothetical protein